MSATENAIKLYWRLAADLQAARAGDTTNGTVEELSDEIAGYAVSSQYPNLRRRYASLVDADLVKVKAHAGW